LAGGETSWKKLLPYLLLSVAVLFSFGRAIQAPFHFDDHALALDPAITSPGGGLAVWRISQTRPLTYFTFWLNHRLGGANPAGYHAVNLAIHLMSSFLVMLCLRRLMPPRAALIAAFVFAIHPVQTEAVVYVFARSTLLSSCLTYASLYYWLIGRHWLAVAWFAAALLAKEEVAAFPVFLALLHVTISANRRERAPMAAMLLLAIAAVVRVAIVAAYTPGSGAGSQSGIAPFDYFLTQGYPILRYLQLLAVPVGFTVDPEIEILRDWRGLVCWLTVAALAVIALRFAGRARAGFWLLAALILIAPTSSILPAADLAADRRLCLPMLGFSAIVGLLLERTTYPVLLSAGGGGAGDTEFRSHRCLDEQGSALGGRDAMGPDDGPTACSTRTGLATGSSSGLFARSQKNCARRPARSVRIGEAVYRAPAGQRGVVGVWEGRRFASGGRGCSQQSRRGAVDAGNSRACGDGFSGGAENRSVPG
jgi:hypothetical protein